MIDLLNAWHKNLLSAGPGVWAITLCGLAFILALALLHKMRLGTATKLLAISHLIVLMITSLGIAFLLITATGAGVAATSAAAIMLLPLAVINWRSQLLPFYVGAVLAAACIALDYWVGGVWLSAGVWALMLVPFAIYGIMALVWLVKLGQLMAVKRAVRKTAAKIGDN